MLGNELGDVDSLELPSHNPDHRVTCAECCVCGVRVRGFRVIDPPHAVGLSHKFGAMVIDSKGCYRTANDRRFNTIGTTQTGCSKNICHRMWGIEASQRQLTMRREFDRRIVTVLEKRPINDDVVDHSQVATAGDTQIKADCATAFNDIGVFDHSLCCGHCLVVDAGNLCVVVHLGFRSSVCLGTSVPIEVIISKVETDARKR